MTRSWHCAMSDDQGVTSPPVISRNNAEHYALGNRLRRLASGQGVRLNRHRGIHQFRISQAKKLADQVAARGRRLKAIIVTHPDSDHYIGTAVLRERFPDTPIYLTAAALDRMYNAACASKSVPRVRIPGRTHSTPDASGPSCWALGQLARGPRPPYRWRATRPGCRRRLRAPPAFAAYLGAAPQTRMGGLRKTALRRPATGARNTSGATLIA